MYIDYNETNDQIYAVESGYVNSVYYDGTLLQSNNASTTLIPGEVRQSRFWFRFGSPVRNNIHLLD